MPYSSTMQKRSKAKSGSSEILAADVRFISLCFNGKTGVRGIYKAEGDDSDGETVVKALCKALDDDQGRILTCIYPPSMKDSDNEWASAEAVEQMAYEAMRKGVAIDVMHDEDPTDSYLAESFIIQPTDDRFDGMTGPNGKSLSAADLAGGWGGVIQLDDAHRALYKEKGWGGVSIGGDAVVVAGREPIAKAELSGVKALVSKFLSHFKDTKTSPTTQLRGLHMDISLAIPGEVDYNGNPTRDSFHISASGDLTK